MTIVAPIWARKREIVFSSVLLSLVLLFIVLDNMLHSEMYTNIGRGQKRVKSIHHNTFCSQNQCFLVVPYQTDNCNVNVQNLFDGIEIIGLVSALLMQEIFNF